VLFKYGRPHFLVQKTSDFSKLSKCGHLADKGGGQFFAILCGRLLWTAPNHGTAQNV